MKLSKRIEAVLERHDIRVCGDVRKGYRKGEYDIELETFSPLGEDFLIALIYDGTKADFIRKFAEYADDFDAEEHASMWIEYRGTRGIPDSIRDLIQDAEDIKEMLSRAAAALKGINKKAGCTIIGGGYTERIMQSDLYKYLRQFMISCNWLDEHIPEQARSIFTTICLFENIDADTEACSSMLLDLYKAADTGSVDVGHISFKAFMIANIR